MIATQYSPAQLRSHLQGPDLDWNIFRFFDQEQIYRPTIQHSTSRSLSTGTHLSCHVDMAEQEPDYQYSAEHGSDDTITSLITDHQVILEPPCSEDEVTPDRSTQGSDASRSPSHGPTAGPQTDHVIHLSSLEHCMPRAYIRICLAYRVPSDEHLRFAIQKLREFVQNIVEAKPYLAGYVTEVKDSGKQSGRAEIRFTTHSYRNYPMVEDVELLNSDGSRIKYDELNEQGLPPSRLRPEDVSALPPNVDGQEKAHILRVRANVVNGGLIVSFYLHHCISDGTGFDLITSGDLLHDDFTFRQPDTSVNSGILGLEELLKEFARQKSSIRQKLSTAPKDTINSRQLRARRLDEPPILKNKPGRGCIVMISASKISSLKQKFNEDETLSSCHAHTTNSILMAILWQHMTRARRPSISMNEGVEKSRLLVPVDIRDKLSEHLPNGYFGAAVDSAKVELDLDSLTTTTSTKGLHDISHMIRHAIVSVDDDYVRQGIAFANAADDNTDVQDIQAANMDRATGADMYITSWLKLRTYQHDLGMGLGGPDWVRKPWSRDPGSCIILPKKSGDPDYYEIVVQMTEADMVRLLEDMEFMEYVKRVID